MPGGSTTTIYKPGSISIVTLSDGSDIGNRVSGDSNQVWFDLPDELSKYTGSPLSYDARKPEVQQLIKQFQVKKFPAVLFLKKKEGTQWEIKNTLTGNVPIEAIEATYWRVLNNMYGRGDNALSKAVEENIGLLNVFEGNNILLSPKIMKIGLSIIAILAGGKAATADNTGVKIAFGSVAALVGYKLFYPGKSTIHFE